MIYVYFICDLILWGLGTWKLMELAEVFSKWLERRINRTWDK